MRTIEIASLLGDPFPIALLQNAAGAREEIDALFEKGVFEEGDSPREARFRRPGEARRTAESIPWSRRRSHYAALAEAARAMRLPAGEIAGFFESAQEIEIARGWWIKAAEKACRTGAYSDALEALDRALSGWPWNEAPEERVRILREMARCALNGGRSEPARRAWEELAEYADEAGQPLLLVEALRQLAALGADPARVGECLKRAAAVAEDALPPAEAVREILAYVDHLASRVRVGFAAKELARAVRLAEREGDPAQLSEVRGWEGLLAAMSGEHGRARELVRESLRLALDHDLTEQAAVAYRRRANIEDYGGNYQGEKEAQTAAIEFCRQSAVGGELVCLGCLSYACFRTGDWQEAIQTARSVARDDESPPTLRAIGECVLGLVASFRGERGPATRHLEQALRRFRIDGFAGMEFFALLGQAYLAHADGDLPGATEACDQARALWRETDDVHDIVPVLLIAGGTYADTGDAARLADCLDILDCVLRRNPLPEPQAALAALQAEQAGLDGRPTDCGAGLADAASRYAALALPFERLWIECRRVVLAGNGRAARGDESASRAEAVDLARRLGMRPALAILESGDGSLPQGHLTPRQQDVLRLLAEGLTSKEIGDRLGLSTRTVEMHVGRLLQRLNCRTRPEAVRFAIERGWLPTANTT